MGALNPAKKPRSISLNYFPRVGACLAAVCLNLAILAGEDRIDYWVWLPLLVYGLLFPHVAYYFTQNPKLEVRNILADTFFYSVSVGLWGFPPFLLAMFLATSYLALISYGGKRFIIFGSLVQGTGLIVGGWITGFYFRTDLELVPTLIGTVGIMVFLINMGMILNSVHKNLSKTKARLKTRQQELENLNEVALSISRNLDLDHVLTGIMEAIEKIYPFESLYVVNKIPSGRYKIIGAYGSAVNDFELNAFKELEMDPLEDKNSIFVSGIQKNRIVVIPHLTPQMVAKGAEMDKALYNIKPSKSIAYFPVSIDGEVVAGVAFINYGKTFDLDEHDQKRISEYLVQVGTALRNARVYQEATEAKERAEQSEQAKSRFLANMSHEIRTPMTAILGYGEALLDKSIKSEERDEFVQTIIRSGKHLLTIINDILDISKIESSKMEVESVETDLVTILSDLEAYARLNTKEKGLNYGLDVEFPLPRKIISDPTRIKQILYNLTNNAIKFTQHGGITTHAYTTEDSIHFLVSDTGIGMDEEAQEKLFAAFSQADTSTTRLYGGTGLGLYISKSLAHLMGGDLTLTSEAGKGSTFCLTLPLRSAHKGLLIKHREELDSLIERHLDHVKLDVVPNYMGKVLVAEDNPENQSIIRRLLSQTGLNVMLVENGKLAWEQTKQESFDLIFLDMQMPVMGGKEAASHIRASGIDTPLVAFTANVMKHQVEAYTEMGFCRTVEKPISQTALYQVLAEHFQTREEPDFNDEADHSPKAISKGAGSVLVVEDNPVNQTIVKRMVEKLSHEVNVSIAGDGQQAVELITQRPFDLVLMDMEMPIMGGLEATEHIRGLGNHLPIFMVTGNIDKEYVQACTDAGANGHLAKPIDKAELKKILVSTGLAS